MCSSDLKRISGLAALAMLGVSAAFAAPVPGQSEEATLRAGRNIASTSCVACHVVSETQTVKPVLGPGIPSFQEIAARPGVSAEALDASMKEKRWHDPGMARTLLPMSRLSDRERAQVVAYILSLKK